MDFELEALLNKKEKYNDYIEKTLISAARGNYHSPSVHVEAACEAITPRKVDEADLSP